MNELGMDWVGIGWVLCPFPCNVFAVFLSGTPPLAPSEKQQVMIQDLMTKLKSLKDREADWETHIAVQEDTIQISSAEVEVLKEKMCRCQDSPHISQGSGRAESPYKLEGEQPEVSSTSNDDRL